MAHYSNTNSPLFRENLQWGLSSPVFDFLILLHSQIWRHEGKCCRLNASELWHSHAHGFSQCVLNLAQVLHEPPQTAVKHLPSLLSMMDGWGWAHELVWCHSRGRGNVFSIQVDISITVVLFWKDASFIEWVFFLFVFLQYDHGCSSAVVLQICFFSFFKILFLFFSTFCFVILCF